MTELRQNLAIDLLVIYQLHLSARTRSPLGLHLTTIGSGLEICDGDRDRQH